MTDQSFIHHFGGLINTIKLLPNQHQLVPTTIRLDLNDHYMLVLTPEDANTMLIALAQRLYDDGTMTRAAAESINHLSNVVLMDAAEYAEAVAMHSGEDY